MLMRFFDRYTAAPTAHTTAIENRKNKSHAVLGHFAHRDLSRYAPALQSAHRCPWYSLLHPAT